MFFEKLGNKKYLLLHYKNVDMHKAYFNDRHTNSWEITEIIRIFNILGWNVELVDRTVSNWVPTRNYDLFISNSSGSSGDNFVIMSEKIPTTFKVMYAAGPAVDISNQLVNQRYEDLIIRKNLDIAVKPLRTFKTNIDMIMSHTNEIICIDDNGFSSNSYRRFGKPIHLLNPSSSPGAFDTRQTVLRKSKSKFMLFLGNGFIAKGGDVVLDALKYAPKIELNICGPYKSDPLFWKLYKKTIKHNSNVNSFGYVHIGSRKYFNVIKDTQWQIHNSAAEGCATAVTTLLRAGIVPISNYETGVDVNKIGIGIKNTNNDNVASTVLAIEEALDSKNSSIDEFMQSIYKQSVKFTRERFTVNFLQIAEKITRDL